METLTALSALLIVEREGWDNSKFLVINNTSPDMKTWTEYTGVTITDNTPTFYTVCMENDCSYFIFPEDEGLMEASKNALMDKPHATGYWRMDSEYKVYIYPIR